MTGPGRLVLIFSNVMSRASSHQIETMPVVPTALLNNVDKDAYRVLVTAFGVRSLRFKKIFMPNSNDSSSLSRITRRTHRGSLFSLFTIKYSLSTVPSPLPPSTMMLSWTGRMSPRPILSHVRYISPSARSQLYTRPCCPLFLLFTHDPRCCLNLKTPTIPTFPRQRMASIFASMLA